jgi:DNA-binding SARP family transcriptional activator
MLLQVLGPVEARSARGHVIRLRPREKAVLGYLLLHAGQPCSADTLIQDVWGDDLPADPCNTLRLVISRIRHALKPETIITTIGSGTYQADPAPAVLDKHVFEALLADASEAEGNGQHHRAAHLLEQALARWPHPQAGFPSVPDSLGVRGKTERLLEQRRAAEIRLTDLHLALGRHEATLPGLRARCVADPGSERTWSQLMLALFMSGRRGEALDAYEQASQVLDKEYGTHPGIELKAMLARVLDGVEMASASRRNRRYTDRSGSRPCPRSPRGRHADGSRRAV